MKKQILALVLGIFLLSMSFVGARPIEAEQIDLNCSLGLGYILDACVYGGQFDGWYCICYESEFDCQLVPGFNYGC